MRPTLLYAIFSTLFLSALNGQSIFEDITSTAGVAAPGAKSHGVSFADFDGDGDEDIFLATRLQSNKLFVNNGDGTFTDAAAALGLDDASSSRAAAWGDFNNDGYIDVYVGNYQTPDKLYLNAGPDGNPAYSFKEVSLDAGIDNLGETISVQLADVDQDGFLDIYVLNFRAENILYKNNGDGTFIDATLDAGLFDAGASMSSLFFDYDLDGDLDLYIVHDFEEPNLLYQNDGSGYFEDVASAAGLALAAHGMGVDAADINHDGYFDLYITDLDENYLFLNNGDGTFQDISATAEIEDTGMGWSSFFLDFDNDGFEDLYVVNDSGFSPKPNVLYRNNGDNTFSNVGEGTTIGSKAAGVGGAHADIDGNGAQDIIVTNPNTPAGNQLFRNSGNSNNWISFKLARSHSNQSPIGARVVIEYGDGLKQYAEVRSGNGFGSASTQVIHFGLREFGVVKNVKVFWPGGTTNDYAQLASNQYHTLTETPAPSIVSVTPVLQSVERYTKFETAVDVVATFENPDDYDQISVSATFTGPDGMTRIVDGYFHKSYTLNTSSGSLTPTNTDSFRIRFSPDQVGEWTYQVSVEDAGGISSGELLSFNCTAATSSNNNGFSRTGESNYMEYDNGEQYVLIGQNIGWPNNNPYTDYRKWVGAMADEGGNFFRLWHAHWGLGIEWKKGFKQFEGLRHYEPKNSYYQDWLFDFSAERGVGVMLTIQHHGPVSSNVNPNWNDSPYNVKNGGPCNNTWDFFTNEEAKDHTKNRLRYIVARWGYSRAIQSWELFNEVNWTDDFLNRRPEIAEWHEEMAAYLKDIDPYQHSVTTSYAHVDEGELVWPQENIDYTQTHYYINSSNIERALAGGVQEYLTEYGKPTLTGEFGLGGSANLANADADGVHLHNGMWGSLFAGGMGTAMTWWWDNYIHPRDLYYHFSAIATVVDDLPLATERMEPTQASITGAPGDLIISPTLGWGAKGDDTITISASGELFPEIPALNQYLYGSEFNTDKRTPPTFSVDYPEAGNFTVRTNTEKGQGAKISLYLDGVLVLDEEAVINTDFTITIPAGKHDVLVDNLGTDWATISSFTFAGVGSEANVYALRGQSAKVAAGWVLNHRYNHKQLAETGAPDPIIGASIVVDSMASGNYFVKWYDCLTGQITSSEAVTVSDGEVMFPIPELAWDAVFRIDVEDIVVGTKQQALAALNVEIAPNPARAGDELQIQFTADNMVATKVILFSADGRPIHSVENAKSLVLPNNLPTGYYLVSISYEGQAATKGILVR